MVAVAGAFAIGSAWALGLHCSHYSCSPVFLDWITGAVIFCSPLKKLCLPLWPVAYCYARYCLAFVAYFALEAPTLWNEIELSRDSRTYLDRTILASDHLDNARSVNHFRIAIAILDNADNPRLVALLLSQISAEFCCLYKY